MNRLTSELLGLCLLVAGGALISQEWPQQQSVAFDGIAFYPIVADRGSALQRAQAPMVESAIRHLEGLGYLETLPQPITLPFGYVGKHILVAAQLPSAPQTIHLILDTGVRSPLLDWQLTSQIPLSHTLRLAPQALYGVLERISLAEAHFYQIGTFAVEFSAPGQPLYCLSESGVIGGSVMRHGVWQIDYPHRTLTIAHDTSTLDHIHDAIALPFDLVDFQPLVTLDVAGKTTIRALIDTGWHGSLHLSAQDLSPISSTHIRTMATAEGLVETLTGLAIARQQTIQLSRLSLGDLHLENFPVSVDVGPPLHPTALIGNDFLEHFIVTLDYANQQLYLLPTAPSSELYPAPLAYGFQAMLQGDRLLVTGLHHPSAAAQAGLQIGDQILSINGDRYTNLSADQSCNLIHHPVGDRYTGNLQVTVARGGRSLTYTVMPDLTITASEAD